MKINVSFNLTRNEVQQETKPNTKKQTPHCSHKENIKKIQLEKLHFNYKGAAIN